MARPKNNKKVIETINSRLSDTRIFIDQAVAVEDYRTAELLKSWRDWLVSLSELIEDINKKEVIHGDTKTV
jgi:hypothetical protein